MIAIISWNTDDIIKRLKEAGENLIQLANFNNKKAVYYTETWSALMKDVKQEA